MSRTAYDRYISVFSPEGRLYQVEYAFKAIKGPALTSVGLRGENCAVVVTQRKVPDKLLKRETVTHVFSITKTIGAVITGRIGDGKDLVYRARETAADFWSKYGYDMPPSFLAQRIATMVQVRTQYVGVRPFGAAITLIGMEHNDDGTYEPRVFKVDPAGHFMGYSATTSGQKEVEAVNYLEKKNKTTKMNTLSYDDAIMMGISTLQSVLSTDFKGAELEVGVVSDKDRTFKMLSEDTIEEYLTRIAERD